jgi:hypothetical protein
MSQNKKVQPDYRRPQNERGKKSQEIEKKDCQKIQKRPLSFHCSTCINGYDVR